MNKVMFFLGLAILMITSWLNLQSILGYHDKFIWSVYIIILSYFVIRAVAGSKEE